MLRQTMLCSALISILVCMPAIAFQPHKSCAALSQQRTNSATVAVRISEPLDFKFSSHKRRFAFQLSSLNDAASTETVSTPSTAILAEPQVFASGYSTNANLIESLREAVEKAVQALPVATKGGPVNNNYIDLAIVSVSSLYDGGVEQPAMTVVPTVLKAVYDYYEGAQIRHLVGSSVAGCISSTANTKPGDVDAKTATTTIELEGIPSVSVTLALLPDVELRTFDCGKEDILDDVGRLPANEWKRPLGLMGFGDSYEDTTSSNPVFMVLPSPAFSSNVEDLLFGLSTYFPGCQVFGGITSTVSSLSRAKLYRYSANQGSTGVTLSDGCVGVAMQGDIQLQTLSAQGAKPVGGIYRVLKGSDSTIQAIVLDEEATALLDSEEIEDTEEDEEEEEDANMDARARMQQAYAKARIPKPPLAEANFLMRTLSDDDQAFMRRQLLIGLDMGGNIGRTASELARLAEGEGHRFRVLQVASGGMKDGSVTFALGSVDIVPGTRVRFFVRESGFAKREVEALWVGYKKRQLDQQFRVNSEQEKENAATMAPPTCVFMVPTLDRGSKFFLGKAGFESSVVSRMIPSVPCVSGFFGNGVVGQVDVNPDSPVGLQGSASGYFLLSSRSGRPVYSAARAAAAKAAEKEQAAMELRVQKMAEAEDAKRRQRTKGPQELDGKAPRSEDGELILKRREVHSGRALTVSTVEWSVAEKTATPSSVLEGFMWEKETEVDRFRERVPLVNLVSQCRLSASDPNAPKPRDFIGPIRQAISGKGFVVIPECKRMEPSIGSLRRRYDVSKLVKSFTLTDVPAVSVNCDGVLFGGSLDDITTARQAASAASIEKMSEDGVVVPPILASDLLLYPYQLYKLRLAGADAVTLVVGALPKKDLTYLIKIASSLQLQTLASVNSEVQLQSLVDIPARSICGIILSNRELEDFSFDMSGEQALKLLQSAAMANVREVHGSDIPVLVEGRVGLIERPTAVGYLKALKSAGASGCIVGGGLITDGKESSDVVRELQQQTVSEE